MDQAKRLQKLEIENSRFKQGVADRSVHTLILKEVTEEKYLAPRTDADSDSRERLDGSKRRNYKALGISRNPVRYVPQPRKNEGDWRPYCFSQASRYIPATAE